MCLKQNGTLLENRMDYTKLKERVLALDDISLEEAMFLYREIPSSELLYLGDRVRFIHNPKKEVSWQIDRNVNYTNVCVSGCKFCTFHCRPDEAKEKGFLLEIDEYRPKIKELLAHGGNQLLLQGGLHPHLKIEYFENLLTELRKIEPSLRFNAFGPPEIAHIARISKISTKETLQRLIKAGLTTFPGAGAEILDDMVRKNLSPAKPSAAEWVRVMKEAQALGLSTTATMVYGTIESDEQRLNHIFTIKKIQEDCPAGLPGFKAFILWPMQTPVKKKSTDVLSYLRNIAISRIILNNVPHIQASWLTVGPTAGQLALHCGADDMGSIMIEENVVSSANTRNTLDERGMVEKISEAGFIPWLRDQEYNRIRG